MATKMIIRIGVGLIVAMVGVMLLYSFTKPATDSSASPCKESVGECCNKKEAAENSGDIDFETLSGKFFSAVSY